MNSTDPIGQDYVRLALRIDRHVEGYVDSYYGPVAWKAEIEAEPLRPVAALLEHVARLQDRVAQAEMDAQRRDFLTRQLTAMVTVLKRLSGEELSLAQEVRGCFDITPQRVPEAQFDATLRELDALLPGTGDLAERQVAWKRQFELQRERVLPVLEVALAEVRRRTLSILPMPDGESVSLKLVSDQPWVGYNWYLGSSRSRIEINTDLPVRADDAVAFMAHEAYPGHHTEHALKDERWYRQAQRLEHSVLLLMAPECTISEGLAMLAEELIFPDRSELAGWLREVLYPMAGIQADADLQMHLATTAEALDRVSGNAAFLLHEDQRPQDQVLQYIRRYSLCTEKEARQILRFIGNPTFRAYTFNYSHGRRLLKQAAARSGLLHVFRWAVTEPVTPSAVAARFGLASGEGTPLPISSAEGQE
jgi:hypothetical protein